MADNQDILIDNDGNFIIENGDFKIGDGTIDDCSLIIGLNTGVCKIDPILGPNLIRMTNGKISTTQLKQEIKLHLSRDGKNPKKIEIENGSLNIEM